MQVFGSVCDTLIFVFKFSKVCTEETERWAQTRKQKNHSKSYWTVQKKKFDI